MSERSKRRAAEMKVINEAAILVGAWYIAEGSALAQVNAAEFLRLQAALRELDALGLAEPDATPTNHPPEQTSLDAAASMKAAAGSVAYKVFAEVLAAHRAGATGLTTDQVELRLGGTHQGISPRVTDLVAKGWLVDSGCRRPTRSGRKAIVWRPTQLALSAAALVPEWRW